MFADFRRAAGLLTVLPVKSPPTNTPGRAMAYYPVVGALIGGVLAGVTALLDWSGVNGSAPLLPPAVVLAAWAGVTGALHLDGWADCCDAFFAPLSRDRRLEIMKDSRLGGFGAVGLVILVLAKFAALQGVLGKPHALWALVGIAAAARWAVVVAAYSYPSARPGGMGDYFRTGLSRPTLVIATVLCIAAVAPLLLRGVVVVATVALVCLLWALFACARLGGLTGDVYGAVVELGETAALAALCFLP